MWNIPKMANSMIFDLSVHSVRVEITEILYHTFWQKFRENNVFTKEITKEFISRNIFSVREDLRNFHAVQLLLIKSWFHEILAKNLKFCNFTRKYVAMLLCSICRNSEEEDGTFDAENNEYEEKMG